MRRKRGIFRRGRHARRDAALILRRRPLLTGAVALALGPALLAADATASGDGTGHDAQALRVVHETYAGELGLARLSGVTYSPARSELLLTGRTATAAAPVAVAVDRLGDISPRGQLVPALDGPDLAVDVAGRELIAATDSKLIAAGTGETLLDLASVGVGTLDGVDQGPDGGLFLLDAATRGMVYVPRNGKPKTATEVSLETGSGSSMTDIAYNPTDGLLYTAEATTGRISSFTTDGQPVATYEAPGVQEIGSIEFAPSADTTDSPAQQSLYVTDSTGAPGGRLLELSTTAAPAVAAAATEVQVSLVRTTGTSGYSPPSPDPSGVAFLTDRDELLISDAEVEEMQIYAGANLWRTSLVGPAVGTGDTTSFSLEPTGVAYNPANGHLLVSDDNADQVFNVNPGPDALPGTADDTVTSFSTAPSGNGDPEGVALDTGNGDVYTIDGVNKEVYLYRGGSAVSHFDVGVFGLGDPEGIDFDSVRDTLVIVDQVSKKIYEISRQGELVSSIDISAAAPRKAAGVAVAPASDGSGARNYYVVARGVDNDNHPNENDGKLYEFAVNAPPPPVGNVAPVVNAGPDQRVDLSATAQLDGSVTDDGLPSPPAAVSTTWSMSSGPGTVTFGDTGALSTTADFSAEGSYVLQLTASDGELEHSDSVAVEVLLAGPAPTDSVTVPVSQSSDDAEERLSSGRMYLAGTDLELAVDGTNAQAVGLRFADVRVPAGAVISSAYVQFTVDEATSGDASLTVQGQAADNAPTFTGTARDVSSRPRTAAAVPWAPPPWSTAGASGPDQRTPDLWPVVQEIVDRPGWADGNALALVITGSGDRKAESFDGTAAPVLHIEFTFDGPPPNRAPSADAGPDQTVTLPAAASLSGSVSDDGLPDPPGTVSTTWAQLSGPGTVAFADGSAGTTAQFSAPGGYVLELTASDGELSATDTVAVRVLPEGTTEPVTLEVPVAPGNDDAEERLSTGAVTTASGDLNLGTDAGRPQIAGLRFSGLSIPPGSTIQSAYLQFTVDEVSTGAASLSVTGQAVDNAPQFQSVARDLSSRPTTTASVDWTPPAWPTAKAAGPDQRTPDLASVVGEIVSRPGWVSGGSVVLLVRGDGERTVESYEGRSPPVLHVVYLPPAT